MPRYKKETLLAMERAKHPEDNIINVEYIRNRYLNKDPITKEEIEAGLKNAFSEVFNNIFLAEIESELGYTKYDYKNKGLHSNGNSRNGYTKKTLKSDLAGEFEVNVPRDRLGLYEPTLVGKYEKDVSGFEDKIIAMYAKGMSTEAINNFMKDLYGINVSTEQVSKITDKIIPIMREWQNRPLYSCYPIIYLDGTVFDVLENGVYVKKTVYIVIGINLYGYKDVIGMYVGENESSKYWYKVLADLKDRGIKDIFIACVDGLNGFENAITSVFPNTIIQRCIIHIVRNSVKFVSYKDLKKVCSDLKSIYQANSEDEALYNLELFKDKWDSKYSYIYKIWKNSWNSIRPMFDYSKEIRRMELST